MYPHRYEGESFDSRFHSGSDAALPFDSPPRRLRQIGNILQRAQQALGKRRTGEEGAYTHTRCIMPEATNPDTQHDTTPYCPTSHLPSDVLQQDISERTPTQREADFRAYHFGKAVAAVDIVLSDAVYPIWQIDALTKLLIRRLATQYPSTQAGILVHIAEELADNHGSGDALYNMIVTKLEEL